MLFLGVIIVPCGRTFGLRFNLKGQMHWVVILVTMLPMFFIA